ncbi:MAG: hypothetical protein LBD59_06475 [Prevotellaceae bacterium]|jgi:hypothetical protein|nr:hypothetical protein [Prevotellaceae bacterium]
MNKNINMLICIAVPLLFAASSCDVRKEKQAKNDAPRIVNIVNFIRQVEPRMAQAATGSGEGHVSEEMLYRTVVEQVKQLKQYDLPGTFLLQYDALINPKYQELLKNETVAGSEVGAWWEITQPHVEAAGMKWRGRYPWDWHADVGFATGYSPQEREKLVDVYMEKFRSIFGKYPASVGSWFIDAHTLAYMYDRYKISASCNCKDQIGTDGYTLWGGYWNQAYYPSRRNAYMPAQTADGQIPVPVFRMLGSDPVYQYDCGLGSMAQWVLTLEPACRNGGEKRQWVEWFFDNMVNRPCLAFNYIQVGQENSFLWENMQKGLNIQIPLVDSLRRQGKISVETLETSGQNFKNQYPLTPATAVTALTDHKNEGRKTVWYNSRFYRANLLWNKEQFHFRDVHLFDERMESDYLTKAGTSTQCIYSTLPLVDGFVWSTATDIAGMRLTDEHGARLTTDGNPAITELSDNVLQVEIATLAGDLFRIVFYEDRFEVECVTTGKTKSWMLEMKAAENAELPFRSIDGKQINASYRNFDYSVECLAGSIEQIDRGFCLKPAERKIIVKCKQCYKTAV